MPDAEAQEIDEIRGRSGVTLSRFIQETAREAGHILRERYYDQGAVESKGRGNIVSEVDVASERLISRRVYDEFPGFSFLGEETGERPGDAGWQWITDPVDGTRNYVSHYPMFCIMVSLARRGRVVAAGTYDPLRDEMFYAQVGHGATLNGQPIGVSESPKRVQECVVGMDLSYIEPLGERALRAIYEIWPGVQAVRIPGSIGLAMAYLAAGRFDLYFCPGGNAWDIAAGSLLIPEAGGVATDRNGAPISLPSEGVVAGNADVHADFMRITKDMPLRSEPHLTKQSEKE
ncbi:MAG: inositol monophosphatase family protein [Chloroflexota bacterium]